MKVTICGSIAFYAEMQKVKNQLEQIRYEVKLPPEKIKDENGNLIAVTEYYALRKAENIDDNSWIWDQKERSMFEHFEKIDWADAVLILNYDKKDIKGYIGANTLVEMGLALYLKKPIYLLNEIPEISYREEILGMKPIIINGHLEFLGASNKKQHLV